MSEDVARFVLQSLGHHVWQGALLACLFVALPRALRLWNAETRYWLSVFALAAITLSPLAAFLPRPVRFAPPATADSSPAVRTDLAPGPAPSAAPPTVTAPAPSPRVSPAVSTAPSASVSFAPAVTAGGTATGLLIGWAVGTGWMLFRLGRQVRAASRLVDRARPANGAIETVALGTMPVRVLISSEIRSPLAAGLLRPAVLLPEGFPARFSPDELRQILVHETAHVERRDGWICLAQRLCEAIWFFHPAVRWVAGRMELEREASCDDRAAASGDPRRYASCLLKVSESLQGHPRPRVMAAGALASRSQLSERIRTMLDTTRDHATRVSRRALAGFAAACIVLLGLFSIVLPEPVFAQPAARSKSTTADAVQLILAARTGNLDEVRRLLDAGIDPDASQPDGNLPRSALNAAARGGHTEVARLLLDRGATVDLIVRGDGTALMAAAREGHYDVAELLVQRGADVNRQLSGDGTPLINAARGGNPHIVEMLLEAGAEIDAAVSGDGNPLVVAAQSRNSEIVELLMEHGADPDVFVRGDGTSLLEAARRGDLRTVQALVARGADPNRRVPGDGSALIAAVRSGNDELVGWLIDHGADVNMGVSGDGNPLIMAAKAGDLRIVELLLDRGADIDMGVPGDGNALIKAARHDRLLVVRALIDRGADIEAYVRGDETPLIAGAGGGSIDSVRMLIEAGADVTRVVSSGGWGGEPRTRSALGEAERRGHDDVADLLRRHGAR